MKKNSSKAATAKSKHKVDRQTELPGMADAKIAAIEKLALDYAEVRDSRIELSQEEGELKQALIVAMHNAGKATYKRNGIEIELTVEKEKVKVRVKEEDQPSVERKTKKESKQTEFNVVEIEKKDTAAVAEQAGA